MSKVLLVILLAITLLAQTNRSVVLNWSASTSSGVVGYNIYRQSTATFGGSPINGTTPINATTYTDATAVIGQTYTYWATAVGPACTPTTPVTTACGESVPSVPATTTIPTRPNVTVTVTVQVQ